MLILLLVKLKRKRNTKLIEKIPYRIKDNLLDDV